MNNQFIKRNVLCPLDGGKIIGSYDWKTETHRLFHYTEFGDFCRNRHCVKCEACYDLNSLLKAANGDYEDLERDAKRYESRLKNELEERERVIRNVLDENNPRIRKLRETLDAFVKKEETQLSLFNQNARNNKT